MSKYAEIERIHDPCLLLGQDSGAKWNFLRRMVFLKSCSIFQVGETHQQLSSIFNDFFKTSGVLIMPAVLDLATYSVRWSN